MFLRARVRRLFVCFIGPALLSLVLTYEAGASVTVSVEDNCGSGQLAQNDFTANAIVTTAAPQGCTVRWVSPTAPVSGHTKITLYYGQPGQLTKLHTAPIEFTADAGGSFVASRRFSKEELGSQSFVTVLATSKDEILQWTAWTVRATPIPAEPEPAANQSLDIVVGAVHLDTSRGPFPPSRQAEGTVWAAARREAVGFELDGDDTGAPGIHVTISNSWSPTDVGVASIKEAVGRRIDQIAGITSGQVKLNGLEWQETQPDLVRYEDATEDFERRHFYTVITIWTDATARPLGGRDPKRFAHETSASTWSAEEVTEWASYVRGEYTADPDLLALIERYVRADRAIPGFSHTPVRRGGDDGATTFSLRFVTRLRPWVKGGDAPDDDPAFRAGIESFAIVGSRTGLGTAELVQSEEEKGALCSAMGLFCGDQRVETAKLDKRWHREASSSQLTDGVGNIALVQSAPQIAQYYASREGSLDALRDVLAQQYRGVMKGTIGLKAQDAQTIVLADEGGRAIPLAAQVPRLKLSDLPTKGYFVLGAKLRAGALVRKDGTLFHTYRMIPVNPYVQYVVRTSVIKDRSSVLTGAVTRDVQDAVQLGKDQTPPPPPGWLERALAWFGDLPLLFRIIAFAIPILLIMWFVAPLRPILVGLGRLVGGFLQLLAELVSKLAGGLKR